MIIPTYNELENLPLILGRVRKARPDVHVLVVDDGSPDGTGELADELALADPEPGPRHAPHRQGRPGRGLPGRLRLGAGPAGTACWWRWTPTAATPPNSCTGCSTPSTTAPTWRSARATSTAERCATGPARRLVLSKTANTYSRVLLGVGIHDITAGYRAYRREVLEKTRPVRGRLQGLLLPDRPDLAHHQQRVHRRGGADHVHRTRTRRVEDERIEHPRGDGEGRPVGDRRPARPGPRRRSG